MEEITVPEFGRWGRNKGFWPYYLPNGLKNSADNDFHF